MRRIKIKRRTVLMVVFILLFIVLVSWALTKKLTGVDWISNVAQSISNFVQNKPQEDATPKVIIPLSYSTDTAKLTTVRSIATITIKANKEIFSKDDPRVTLYLSKTDENSIYWYVAELSNIGLGDTNFTLKLSDADGSTQNLNVWITRVNYRLPYGISDIKDWEGSVYTADGNDILAQVDKGHKLPMDFVPTDLIDVNKDLLLYTNSSNAILIRREAGEALRLMAKDLQKQAGKNLVIQSAYREYNEQFEIYAISLRDNGQVETDKIIARPGFSEHQLGTAIDFVDEETGLSLTNDFENGVAGRWLLENCYKYGFIHSYPGGKEEVTGYSQEGWHWRYIGIDNATKLKDSGLTLKEYLDQ